MKIAIILSMPKGRYSGGRKHALLLSSFLSDIGNEVDLYTNRWDTNGQYKNLSFSKIYTNLFRLWFSRGRYDSIILVPEASSRRVVNLIVQLLHLLSIRYLFKARTKFFLDFESPAWKENELKTNTSYWLHYEMVKICDTIVSSTLVGRDYARKDYDIYGSVKRYRVLPPPQILEFVEIDSSAYIKQDSILLFFRQKNLNTEDEYRLSVIIENFQKDFQIHIVCDTCSFSTVIKYANDNVLVYKNPGFSKLRQLYIHAFYFFNLSRFEGFGLTVIEASYFGCVVISTYYEVLSEVYPNCYISDFNSEEDCRNILKIKNKIPHSMNLSKDDYEKLVKYVFTQN